MPEPSRKLDILFVPLEFPSWAAGKPLSYTAQFGIEEGLCASGARTFTVPAFPSPLGGRGCWQVRVPELARGQVFGQAWLGLVHARFEPEFCAWLRDQVPVRVGLLGESMGYSPEECAELPPLAGRAAHVLRQVEGLGLTHVLCSDEKDVAVIRERAGVDALWFPPAVPERFIKRGWEPPGFPRAAFFGDLYSQERRDLMDRPGLEDLLALPRGADQDTGLPAEFDALHERLARAFQEGREPPGITHAWYLEGLRSLRRRIFESWMDGLPAWNGIVNPPSYFKGYGGRVFEAMAAGVPVVSWDVPDRPRNRALFVEGKEILLFRRDDAATFRRHLAGLRKDPALARRLAEAAGQSLLLRHTSEIRIRETLAWIAGDLERILL